MEHDSPTFSVGKRTWGSHLNECIVLVDDSREVLDTLSFALRAAKYVVHTAEDGMTGLAAVRKLRPKVVLLDLFLPHMSGYEVLDAIRSDSTLDGVFVVMITGMARDEEELKELAQKADRCFAKPIEMDALIEAIAEAFAAESTEPGLLKHLHRPTT